LLILKEFAKYGDFPFYSFLFLFISFYFFDLLCLTALNVFGVNLSLWAVMWLTFPLKSSLLWGKDFFPLL